LKQKKFRKSFGKIGARLTQVPDPCHFCKWGTSALRLTPRYLSETQLFNIHPLIIAVDCH
jgi:hypothetical protein